MEPQQLHEQGDRVQLVDVRELEEWQAGRVPGARWIPRVELPDRLGEFDAGRPVVTVCRSGSRSGQMAEFLTERGIRPGTSTGDRGFGRTRPAGTHSWRRGAGKVA